MEVPFLARMPPWRARLIYATRGYLIIDLLAILPFYLGGLLGIDLRVLRVLRLLRFLKLSRYSPAMHTLLRVLRNERRSLMGAGLLLVAALLLSATGMYYIEGGAQPDKFGSVPQAAYWAMTTLTTVGYGDVTPVTPLGKLWSMLTMLFGLCMLALPVAIISTGFAQEVGRRDFVVTWSLMSRIPLLAELDAREVAEVMPLLRAHDLPPNVEVIADGEPGRGHVLRGRRPGAPASAGAGGEVRHRRLLRRRRHARRRARPGRLRHRVALPPAEAVPRGLPPPRDRQPGHRRAAARGREERRLQRGPDSA